jgi:phosphatidylserine decarboxylase
VRWLSERHFFRDPLRPVYSDPDYFYSPADGIIIYQRVVQPDESLVEIKGRNYNLREAMRNPHYSQASLVIGIFMTFYDVHVNRIPYSGVVTHQELEPVESYNRPMLAMEESIVNDLRVDHDHASYLHENQRVLNRIYSWELGMSYYVLQIADYDVDSITPFDMGKHRSYNQNARFSQIRFGSQVDLIIPLSDRHNFETMEKEGTHVEAGIDTLLKITNK